MRVASLGRRPSYEDKTSGARSAGRHFSSEASMPTTHIRIHLYEQLFSSPSDRKEKTKLQLYNTTQRNESTDYRAYSLNPIHQIRSIINSATYRTSIIYHKIFKYNRESLNKRLLQESYFVRNILIYLQSVSYTHLTLPTNREV